MRSDRNVVPVGTLGGLIGFSSQMQRVYSAMRRVNAFPDTVLICGERGTGKEAAARAIHSLSPRNSAPFVVQDCSALAPTLFESELFGHAKGTFLGASHAKWGLLSLAGHGTLFLSQIAELPLNLQGKLLQTFEEGMFSPIGSLAKLPFKARLITATHRDLPSRVEAGTFREDLYLRLSVAQIDLPPLRQRKSDIPLLIDSLIDRYGDTNSPVEFSSAAMNYCMAHDWPGNVAELENIVRSAISSVSGPMVEVKDLNLVVTGAGASSSQAGSVSNVEALPVDEFERIALVRALRESGGSQTAAAGRLGIGQATLHRRLRYYGLVADRP